MADVPITSDAIILEELMTSDEVQLSWKSDNGEELPAGAYVEIDEEIYSLLEPYAPEWINEAFFKYSPKFHSRIMYWQRTPICIYTYEQDGATIKSREFDWSFVGAPADMMFVITQSIFNETGERWEYEVTEGLPQTISLKAQNTNIYSVLSDLAELCDTEWWADKANNVLHLSRCERYSELPLEVGVHVSSPRVTKDREDYYTRFYALGSTKNVIQEMGSGAIAQMVNKRLTLDPIKYPNGYKDIKGHFEDGVFVSELSHGEVFATTLVFDDVFPSSKLKITEARKRLKYRVDENGDKVKIGDDSYGNPIYEQYAIWYFKLGGFNFTEDLIVEGKTLSVNFKTGKLAGREFELSYHDKDDKVQYGDDVEEFNVEKGDYEIIIDESEGVVLPMVDYIIPEKGDEVVLFNINMPFEYTQSAQLELEEELDKEIEKRLKDTNNYEFESYPLAFRDYALSVEVGRRVAFKHNGETFHSRVIRVEKQLDCEYQQKILVGNQKISGSRAQMREEIRNVSEEVYEMDKTQRVSLSLQRNYAQSLRNTVANYLALKDTIELLQGAFKGFSEGINPISVETMLLMLGDTSLQFRIFQDIVSLAPIYEPVYYDVATKHLHVKKSGIVHYTLGDNVIQPSKDKDISGYLKWEMDEFTSGELIEPDARYYLYAKVSKKKQEGYYELIANSLDLDGGEEYNLLVGILNAEYNGTRSFVPLYGYTAIMGGQISTDVIKSTDGQTYFDLVSGVISGDIHFIAPDGVEKPMSDYAEEQKAEFSRVDKNAKNLQDQIDGVVENHFYQGEPTTTNEPASLWTTDEQKINHIGDTYTDIEEFVDSATTPNAGKSWRWCRCDDMVGIEDYVEVTDKDGEVYKLHWHPIADTDAVKALLRTYELEKRVDDAEYLKETFKKGETNISGGIVMTEMVAVGEGGDNIEAFLNGSDFAEDTENGKLILAAGIPEGDADKLEERSAEATTRIYERGKIVTNNIEANGGKFKDVEVLGSSRSPFVEGAWIDGITNYLEDNHYSFNTSGGTYFPLSKDISESGRVITLVGSFAIYGSTGCRIYDRGKLYQNEYLYTGYASDLLPKTNKTDFGFELVRLMAVPYSATEVAWEVIERRPLRESSYSSAYLTGVIGGLRPKTLRNPKNSGSTNQYTLSILDHTIVCEEGVSANFTYTLPSSPEIGQHYEFIKVKASRTIIFKTTDSKKIFRIDNETSDTSIGIGASWGGKIELTYDGIQWLMILIGS